MCLESLEVVLKIGFWHGNSDLSVVGLTGVGLTY